MKKFFTLILIISGSIATSDAFASEIFTCVNEEGKTTFADAPCPPKPGSKYREPTIQEQMAKIDIIDRKIAHLYRSGQNLEVEYKLDLDEQTDAEIRQTMKDEYELAKKNIAKQVARLKARRSQLVETSMSLLSQIY